MEIQLNTANYAASVVALMELAKGDSSSSRTAAQVLLSAYNGGAFQLNVAALCNLDENNYSHAMTVIHGRSRAFTEPHGLFENGDEHFQSLWDQWSDSLHVDERFKSQCFNCFGTGTEADEDGNSTDQPCRRCDGHGKILPDGLEYSH